MSRARNQRFGLAFAIALGVLAADQASKALVERALVPHETVRLVPGVALTYVRNTGAAFGVLAGVPRAVRLPVFLVVTVVAVGTLLSFLRRATAEQPWLAGAVGGILGGALGNLVCRLRYGEVIDFLDLHWRELHWPAFNVADSAITVGVAVLLLHSLRARS